MVVASAFLLLGVLSSPAGASAETAGWALDVDPHDALPRTEVEGSLGAGARRCLQTPRFDAKANGFGTFFVLIDKAGEVRDARYFGFDVAPDLASRFAPSDLARKQRAAFDDLGACLRAASLGTRIGPKNRTHAVSTEVRFLPPGG
jgi:hypothetical protein